MSESTSAIRTFSLHFVDVNPGDFSTENYLKEKWDQISDDTQSCIESFFPSAHISYVQVDNLIKPMEPRIEETKPII